MSTINVRDYGAVGDGKSDDTEAIRKAMDALPEKDGVLFFPPGHYLSDTIHTRSFTTFLGHSAWAYYPYLESKGAVEPQGTVISPVRKEQPCIFDLTQTHGTRFAGLNLRGYWEAARERGGEEMHGIYVNQGGDQVVIDDCRIESFGGSGVKFVQCGVWVVRHSLIIFNRLYGIDAGQCADSWIIDTQLTANSLAGALVHASVTITGNRIEMSKGAGIVIASEYAAGIQITGNLFCCNIGPAIEHDGERAEGITITGNTIRHLPGQKVNSDPNRACHVRLIGMQGLCFTGNSFYCDAKGPTVPCAMILGRLKDSFVSGNTLFHAATKELIRDEGGHENSIIANNPGSLLSL